MLDRIPDVRAHDVGKIAYGLFARGRGSHQVHLQAVGHLPVVLSVAQNAQRLDVRTHLFVSQFYPTWPGSVASSTARPITPYVFHYPDGSPIRDFRKSWRTACEAAGYPGKLFHDFRRTAVRNLERAGVPRSIGSTRNTRTKSPRG